MDSIRSSGKTNGSKDIYIYIYIYTDLHIDLYINYGGIDTNIIFIFLKFCQPWFF